MFGRNGLIALAIARQLGAGGRELGQRLAQRLKFTYLDGNMLRLAAAKAGAKEQDLARWDEHCAKFWDRLGRAFTVGAPEGMWMTMNPAVSIRDRDVFDLQQSVIREISARENCVVIGRAGFWVLRDHPGLVSVYLHAPVESRAARVMKAFGVDEARARKIIAESDADRLAFLREVTDSTLRPESVQLCINTGTISIDVAEKMMLLAVEEARIRIGPKAPA